MINKIVPYLQQHQISPIIISLLKKTRIKKDLDKCVITCQNQGVKIFLENKRVELLQILENYFGTKIELVFLVDDKKIKHNSISNLPLINFQKKTANILSSAGLIDRYTFETFAVSQSNQIAYAAAQAIVSNPGKIYNPFFIYGGVGVGKTHLAQAVANKILVNDGVLKKILFCTSEEFTNDLIDLIQKKNTSMLRKKYRSLDVLVVDDIQFIAGKNYVQEEFFHTFNTIINLGGQIIITSDRPPAEIHKLEDRLKSRFSGGLLIDIQKPDFELRTAILLIKARERNINIEIDAAKLIAEKILDTRELEGVLLRLFTKVSGNNTITTNDVLLEFKNKDKRTSLIIDPSRIIGIVCSYFQIKRNDIKKPTRKESVATARQIVMYILRVYGHLKLEEIAYILNRKDHTTIIHGVNKITNRCLSDPGLKQKIEQIIQESY